MRMNSLKSLAINCGLLSEMIRGLTPAYRSLARPRFMQSRKVKPVSSQGFTPTAAVTVHELCTNHMASSYEGSRGAKSRFPKLVEALEAKIVGGAIREDSGSLQAGGDRCD